MRYKYILAYAIVIALSIWVTFFIRQHAQEFDALWSISYASLSLLLITAFFYLFLQGILLNKALAAFDIYLSFKEWFGLIAITLLGNYIFPFAGLGFRAKYLKKNYALEYTKFSVLLAAIFLIELLIFILGGAIAVSYLYFIKKTISLTWVLGMFAGLIALSWMLFFDLPLKQYSSKLLQKIDGILASWRQVKQNKSVMKALYMYTLLLYLVSAAMFYTAYNAIDLDISFFSALLPTTLSDLSFILRITPGSLGTYDASIIYSSVVLGYTTAEGIIVVTLIRLTTLIWILICGPICSLFLASQHKRGLLKKY